MSALTATGSTRAWRRIRRLVLDRDGYRCRVPLTDGRECGQYADCVDHVVDRADGGTDRLDNLRAACTPCNLRRAAQRTNARRHSTGRRRVTTTKGWTW